MFTIYLVALVGVAIVILAVMADAMLSVSRRAKWSVEPRLSLVETADRRSHDLRFVGADRREANVPAFAVEREAA